MSGPALPAHGVGAATATYDAVCAACNAATVEARDDETIVRAERNGRSFRTIVGNEDMHIAMAAAHLAAAAIQTDRRARRAELHDDACAPLSRTINVGRGPVTKTVPERGAA